MPSFQFFNTPLFSMIKILHDSIGNLIGVVTKLKSSCKSGGVSGLSVFHGSESPYKNFKNRHSQFRSMWQIAEFDALKSLKCCMAYTLV